MTREMIMEELTARGYEVQSVEVVKNGVELQGITIGTGNIRPTIYTEQFKDDDNVDWVADKIINIYEESQKHAPRFDTERLMNWDYVKTHLQLCIQRKGNEDIVKRDFLDLEQYIRVYVTEDASFKVKPEHLEKFGVDADTLFNAAWDCTKPTLTSTNMVILSNESKVHGAIAMYDTWLLSSIADEYKRDLAILPSSIHEVIVMPVDDNTNFRQLSEMVKDVNATQVLPEEQLSDHAYRFVRDTMEIVF